MIFFNFEEKQKLKKIIFKSYLKYHRFLNVYHLYNLVFYDKYKFSRKTFKIDTIQIK